LGWIAGAKLYGRNIGEATRALRLHLYLDLVERVRGREEVLLGEPPAHGVQVRAHARLRILIDTNEAHTVRQGHVLFELQDRQIVLERRRVKIRILFIREKENRLDAQKLIEIDGSSAFTVMILATRYVDALLMSLDRLVTPT
jgi:hypothetical protein